LLTVVGYTHASNVIPLVNCSDGALLIVTKALVPLKVNAFPYLPEVVHVAPLIVPLFPLPDASFTTVPLPSSNPYAATRPSVADGVGVGVGVAVGVEAAVDVAVGVAVAVAVTVAVAVAVAIGVGLGGTVAVAVAVAVGLAAGVAVGVGVAVAASSSNTQSGSPTLLLPGVVKSCVPTFGNGEPATV
jgi:hypothetical protein